MDTPLVLHGGSGLTDEDFRHAIASGISKINIFTDINVAYAEGAKKHWQQALFLQQICSLIWWQL